MNSIFTALQDAMKEGRRIEWITDTETGDECITADGTAVYGRAIQNGARERIIAEPVLVLFGAGHISKALYDLAVLQGMKTIVLDDRESELTEERFPLAERQIAPFEELLKEEYCSISPYFVIFTHGHAYDLEALRYALSRSFSYLGMIGSKAKSSAQIETMRAEGFPEEKIRKIHSPIGVSINAVTPEEIAVSIMAEIISVYREDKSAVTIAPSLLDRITKEEGIVVRIIEKQGSAPRSVGSMMFVTNDRIYSTIGGGRIESLAIDEARAMLKSKAKRKILSFDLGKGGNAGMICGGSVRILLESNED